MFFVYILYSANLDRYYIGSCENVDKRLHKHLSKHAGYTSKAKDWVVRYTEAFDTRTSALARERQLKAWKNRTRIEELITKQGRNS